MNNTDKSIMDAARRMLRGKIDIEEVSMMLNVPIEKLQPIKDELDAEVRKVFGNASVADLANDEVIFDLFDDDGSNDDLDMQSSEDETI